MRPHAALPLHWPVLWLALAASLVGPTAPAAAPRARRVQLEVAGVLPMPDGGASVLVLREKGAKTLLPVMVPGPQDRDLGLQLRGGATPGLLAEAIRALGGKVREVELTAADASPGGARVRLGQGSRQVELAGAASESVALAVAAGAPIFTSRRVMEESGLTPDDLSRAQERLGDGREPLRM